MNPKYYNKVEVLDFSNYNFRFHNIPQYFNKLILFIIFIILLQYYYNIKKTHIICIYTNAI